MEHVRSRGCGPAERRRKVGERARGSAARRGDDGRGGAVDADVLHLEVRVVVVRRRADDVVVVARPRARLGEHARGAGY